MRELPLVFMPFLPVGLFMLPSVFRLPMVSAVPDMPLPELELPVLPFVVVGDAMPPDEMGFWPLIGLALSVLFRVPRVVSVTPVEPVDPLVVPVPMVPPLVVGVELLPELGFCVLPP